MLPAGRVTKKPPEGGLQGSVYAKRQRILQREAVPRGLIREYILMARVEYS